MLQCVAVGVLSMDAWVSLLVRAHGPYVSSCVVVLPWSHAFVGLGGSNIS